MAKTVGNTSGQPNDYTVATGAGTTDSDTQRVVLPTDQTAIPVTLTSTTVTGSVEVTNDSGNPLPVSGTVVGTVPVSIAAAVEIANDAGNPVPVSGTFYQATQPVSGTVTANAGTGPFPVSDNAGSLTVDAPVGTPVYVRLSDGSSAIATLPVSAASLPLPTGAATAAKQPALGTAGAASADVITVQGIASGTAQPVSQSGTWNVGTVTAVTAISNALPAGTNNIGDVDVLTLPNVTLAAGTNTNEVVGDVAKDAALAGNPVRQGVRASNARPTAMSTDGDVVTPAADLTGQQYFIPGRVATATLANVASSATSVTIQAANTSRKGLIVYNDSTQVLYLAFAATASTSSFTYYLAAGATWEMPSPLFTGLVSGIWASANGNARVTELTA